MNFSNDPPAIFCITVDGSEDESNLVHELERLGIEHGTNICIDGSEFFFNHNDALHVLEIIREKEIDCLINWNVSVGGE